MLGSQPGFAKLFSGSCIARPLFTTPHTVVNMPQNLKFDFVQWGTDEEGWKKWYEDKTGVPFVDAGMRQTESRSLHAQHYIHNRLRMNVSSYLYCKVVAGKSVSGLDAPNRSGKAPVLASGRFWGYKNPHGPLRLAQCSLSPLSFLCTLDYPLLLAVHSARPSCLMPETFDSVRPNWKSQHLPICSWSLPPSTLF